MAVVGEGDALLEGGHDAGRGRGGHAVDQRTTGEGPGRTVLVVLRISDARRSRRVMRAQRETGDGGRTPAVGRALGSLLDDVDDAGRLAAGGGRREGHHAGLGLGGGRGRTVLVDARTLEGQVATEDAGHRHDGRRGSASGATGGCDDTERSGRQGDRSRNQHCFTKHACSLFSPVSPRMTWSRKKVSPDFAATPDQNIPRAAVREVLTHSPPSPLQSRNFSHDAKGRWTIKASRLRSAPAPPARRILRKARHPPQENTPSDR